jgi:hypothetical protein
MSGDTTSSDTTWARAARSVDKLDMTAEDGAANHWTASDLDGRDLDRSARTGCALATRGMTEYVGAAHEATADAKAAAEVATDALFSLPTVVLRAGADWLLVDRTCSVATASRSPLLKSLAALGGAGASFEKVVRSGERCSPYGGSTPR